MKMAKTTALLLIILLCLPSTFPLFHTHDSDGPHGSCTVCTNANNNHYQKLLYTINSIFYYTQPTTSQSLPIFTPYIQTINTPITQAVRLNN